MTTHVARWRAFGKTWWACHLPYQRAFVEALKRAVEPQERAWLGGAKLWLVAESHRQLLADLLAVHVDRPRDQCCACRTGTRCVVWNKIHWNAIGTGIGGLVDLSEEEARSAAAQGPDPKTAARILLGVSEVTTEAAIRAAARRAAFQAHPDRGGSHQRMAAIIAARDLLLRERKVG